MKKLILFLIPVMALVSCQTAHAMGFLRPEMQETILEDGSIQAEEVLVLNERGQQLIDSVDAIGDAAGAAGVPLASYAGELLAALLTPALIFANARRKQEKRQGALTSSWLARTEEQRNEAEEVAKILVRSIEKKTTDGAIKAEVFKQSQLKGNLPAVQRYVEHHAS